MMWLSGQHESNGFQKHGLSRLYSWLCQTRSSLFSSLCLDTHNAAAFLRPTNEKLFCYDYYEEQWCLCMDNDMLSWHLWPWWLITGGHLYFPLRCMIALLNLHFKGDIQHKLLQVSPTSAQLSAHWWCMQTPHLQGGGCAWAICFKEKYACRTSSWNHLRQATKCRYFCVIYISHRTMFLIPWKIFCRYHSLELLLFTKGQQSCSSAILRNWVSLWLSMLSSHRNCFLEGLPDSGSLYLPSYQITVINMAQWVRLNLQ